MKEKEKRLDTGNPRNKWNWLIPVAVIGVGILVRMVLIGVLPRGFNQDEASLGYDAFAIAQYGMDRNGIRNPVHLIAWGSGQNAAYGWLCMPLICLLGLSELTVRLPMALVGCVSIIVFYFLLRNLWGEKKTWVNLGTFLFAIFPWHIMKSRWGLESNLFPELVLWGTFALSAFCKNGKSAYLYVAAWILGFSAYSYGSAYCFLPFYVLPLAIYLFATKKMNLRQAIVGMCILGITVFPILLFVVINTFDLPQIDLGLMTIPRLYENRHTQVASLFSGNVLQNCWDNFKNAVKILIRQEDNCPWNYASHFGITYLFSLPMTLWGLGVCAIRFRSRNEKGPEFLMDFWFLASVVLLFVVKPNINRINILMIPWMYYTMVGVLDLAGRIPHGTKLASAVYGLAFLLFVRFYFTDYQEMIAHKFYEGLGEAIVQAVQTESETVYITGEANMPYIYALFYTQTDPNIYRNTVVYKTRYVDFEEIAAFERFRFGIPEERDKEADAVYVLYQSERESFPETEYELNDCGDYVVAKPLGV